MILTHLPSLIDSICKCPGTDYNKNSIAWCRENISNITFYNNELEPKLPIEDSSFDVINGISIFTHLSEKLHPLWFNEFICVLKPEGILYISTPGQAFRGKLTSDEQQVFDKGILVEKGKTKEGHRTYSAYQPKAYFEKIIGQNQVLEFIEGKVENGFSAQDIWIVRKNESL